MANMEIRIKLKNSRIRQWELAEKLGIAEATLSRKFRKELPNEEKEMILSAIDEMIADMRA